MEKTESSPWLEKARQAFSESTSFVDNNYRRKWEDNIRLFLSKHQSGSKYYKSAFKFRSKMFRPKTRMAVRANEAAAVAAFFANQDAATITPQDENVAIQRASAEINQEILNYRLTKTIPWFLICIGAFQDSMVPGVVCSYQDWWYEEREETVTMEVLDEMGMPVLDEETGEPLVEKVKKTVVVKDQPRVELRPVENIRIHPNADWTDPINSSPYLIDLLPMYVMDVKAKMRQGDKKTGKPKWNQLTDGQIHAASKKTYDSTRQVRESGRQDKTETTHGEELSGFDVVWVHRNFIKEDGVDYVFYTLGTEHMLTDPKPIQELYFHGERPYVMGWSVLEAHRIYPSSLVDLGSSIQREINEITNTRMDNVRLVLDKRWEVRRGAQVDTQSILRNVPGSITLVDAVGEDIKPHEFHDVTSSAYQEQNLLNAEFDEIVGTFSTSSVNTNRRLNETVGGMQMLRGSANALVEYTIRTFAETWVEPGLRLLSHRRRHTSRTRSCWRLRRSAPSFTSDTA